MKSDHSRLSYLNPATPAIGLVQSHLIGHFGQRLQLGLILEYGRKLLHLPFVGFPQRCLLASGCLLVGRKSPGILREDTKVHNS